MKREIATIKKAYKDISNAYVKGKKAIISILKEKNGFIAFDEDISDDTICGYDIVRDVTRECRLYGIRLDGESIEVYGVPYDEVYANIFKDWDWENHKEDTYDTYADGDSEGYWFNIEDGLPLFTTYWLLESMLNFVEKE